MPLLTFGEFVEAFFESVFAGNLIQLFEIEISVFSTHLLIESPVLSPSGVE